VKTEDHNSGGALGWVRSWFFPGGERVVSAFGLWVALLVMGVLIAGSAWTFYAHREAKRTSAMTELMREAELLASAVERLVEVGEVSDVRSAAASAAAHAGLDGAMVMLADGPVIADAMDRSGAKGNAGIELPEQWGSEKGLERATCVAGIDGSMVARAKATVVGRGDVIVELTRGFAYDILAEREVQAGLGVIGAAALVGGLVVYRALRRKMRALGAIHESLQYAHQFRDGELPSAGLRLADDLGEEASAWNRLLDERDYLRQRDRLERAAERLQESVSGGGDYAAAFDAVWLGLIVLDESCGVRAINGAAAALLRVQKGEAVSKHVEALVPFRDVTQTAQLVASGKQRQRASMEVTLEPKEAGGEKSILRATVRPLRREDGSAAMVVLEDITQQRVAQESRNSFVAQATHELRTPLTSMRLYLEQLVEDGDKDPLVKARCLNVLTSETRRLERVVGDMLSVSEMDAGTFQLRVDDVDLPKMFEELEQDYQATAADKEITYRVDVPPKWPMVRGDRDKIATALHNIISNAIKYTPQGGMVTVRASEANGQLVVDVTDNGIGIAPEEHEQVFAKFYRSKDKRVTNITGSGIGLALAREVIRMHGGDVTIQSQIDKGSTFTLAVPASSAEVKQAA
jgi:signal transduction histidine kinase